VPKLLQRMHAQFLTSCIVWPLFLTEALPC